MTSQFQHSLSFGEIQALKQQVLGIISTIETKKHKVMPHDFRQLNNNLQYTLTTLNNMHNILAVEKSDHYGSRQADYSSMAGVGGRSVIYNSDGTTKIVGSNTLNNIGEDWEKQFDEGLLMKPPCFQLPPQSLTNINRIRQAAGSDNDLTRNL
jgi:hypothetical protein